MAAAKKLRRLNPVSARTSHRTSLSGKTRSKTLAARQIASFLAKYDPKVAAAARASRTKLRKIVAGGTEFVYDNYNALVFGYGPSERPSEAVLSLAIMPQWVTLCFLKGAKLSDPKRLLKGSGNIVRNVRLSSPGHLDERDVRDLVDQAIAAAKPEFSRKRGGQHTVIKSISAKQRPRRPQS